MKTKTKITLDDYIKANRKASREIELEINIGFKAKDKPHKNKKRYNRKSQPKNWDFYFFKSKRYFIDFFGQKYIHNLPYH